MGWERPTNFVYDERRRRRRLIGIPGTERIKCGVGDSHRFPPPRYSCFRLARIWEWRGMNFPPLSFCLLPFAAFFFFFIPTSKESLTRVQTNGCSGVEWRNREATCLDSACNDHSSENDAMPFAIRENFVARLAGVRPADLPRSVTRSKNKFANFEICCSFFVC